MTGEKSMSEKSRIRAVFSDVDGTLLNSGHRVTPRTAEWIRKLGERDIPFVIVSARSPSGIYPIQRKNGICCPIIAYSGALIQDEKGQHTPGLDGVVENIAPEALLPDIAGQAVQCDDDIGVHLQQVIQIQTTNRDKAGMDLFGPAANVCFRIVLRRVRTQLIQHPSNDRQLRYTDFGRRSVVDDMQCRAVDLVIRDAVCFRPEQDEHARDTIALQQLRCRRLLILRIVHFIHHGNTYAQAIFARFLPMEARLTSPVDVERDSLFPALLAQKSDLPQQADPVRFERSRNVDIDIQRLSVQWLHRNHLH